MTSQRPGELSSDCMDPAPLLMQCSVPTHFGRVSRGGASIKSGYAHKISDIEFLALVRRPWCLFSIPSAQVLLTLLSFLLFGLMVPSRASYCKRLAGCLHLCSIAPPKSDDLLC